MLWHALLLASRHREEVDAMHTTLQVKRRQLRQQIRESKIEKEEAPTSGAAETKKSQ